MLVQQSKAHQIAGVTLRVFCGWVSRGLVAPKKRVFIRGRWRSLFCSDEVKKVAEETPAYKQPKIVKCTKPAQQPTYTTPGSPERIAIYQKRVENGEALFHPDDEKIEIEPCYTSTKGEERYVWRGSTTGRYQDA